VEAPLLREYLQNLPTYPSFAPQLPKWLPWLVFVLLVAVLKLMLRMDVGIILAIIASVSLPYLIRALYLPKTPAEKAEAEFFKSVGKLRQMAGEGTLRKKIPTPVLTALEGAASTHATTMARLHGDASEHAVEESRHVENCMRAAVMAAAPVSRSENQSRREWEAICENRILVDGVADAIHSHERRMSGRGSLTTERLMALRELDGDEFLTHRVSADVE